MQWRRHKRSGGAVGGERSGEGEVMGHMRQNEKQSNEGVSVINECRG